VANGSPRQAGASGNALPILEGGQDCLALAHSGVEGGQRVRLVLGGECQVTGIPSVYELLPSLLGNRVKGMRAARLWR
jgi:hypothetical protein